MSNKIKVKVNLLEFTYKDKKGYHTVVGYGDVPADNQEVQTALKKKWIEEIKDENKNRAKRDSPSKLKGQPLKSKGK